MTNTQILITDTTEVYSGTVIGTEHLRLVSTDDFVVVVDLSNGECKEIINESN